MSDEKDRKATTCVLRAGAVVLFLWVLTWAFVYGWGPQEAGIVGDSFGAVNALFSGLALCGLVYAIYLQRQEIQIARDELARTKDVLVEQQNLTQIQSTMLEKQDFERMFFGYVEGLIADARTVEIRGLTKVFVGRDAFEIAIKWLEGRGPSTDAYGGPLPSESNNWVGISKALKALSAGSAGQLIEIVDQISFIDQFIEEKVPIVGNRYQVYWAAKLPSEVRVFASLVELQRKGLVSPENDAELYSVMERYLDCSKSAMPDFLRKWINTLSPQT